MDTGSHGGTNVSGATGEMAKFGVFSKVQIRSKGIKGTGKFRVNLIKVGSLS